MPLRRIQKKFHAIEENNRAYKFIKNIIGDIGSTNLVNHAYSMAYVTLFSLVPSLAAIFGVISLFIPLFGKNSSLINQLKDLIVQHLATGSGEQAIRYLDSFLQNTNFAEIGASGFAGMVVTLALLLRQIELALNRIFEIEKSRSLFSRFIYFWTILTLGTFLLALAIGTFAGSRSIESYIHPSYALKIVKLGINNLIIFVLFILIYRLVPNRNIPWKHASLGGAIAAILFTQSLQFFSLYITYFTKFAAIYGALSALPTFLFWLYVVWFITLLGAVITKRSMLGIREIQKSSISTHEGLSCTLCPLWILQSIYQNFATGEGKGISDDEICNSLRISPSQCSSGISLLKLHGLIHLYKLDTTNDEAETLYFPAVPANKITFRKLKPVILGTESSWTKIPELFQPLDSAKFHQTVKNLLEGSDIPFSTVISNSDDR